MTNDQAVKRLKQKVQYLEDKLQNENPSERQRVFIVWDLEAMNLAVSALEYVEALALYESAQVPRS